VTRGRILNSCGARNCVAPRVTNSKHVMGTPDMSKLTNNNINNKSVALVFKRTIRRDCRLSEMFVPAFVDRGCCLVSTTDPYGSNFVFLDRNRYFFFQIVPQLYSGGWVDPVPDPLLLRNLVAPGIEHGLLDLQPGTLTTRPQRRSTFFYITYINSIRTSQETQYISVL
jgi:hypothetical protein